MNATTNISSVVPQKNTRRHNKNKLINNKKKIIITFF